MAVDERRHSDVVHLPLAISVRHLSDTIARLKRSTRLYHPFRGFDCSSGQLTPIPVQHWGIQVRRFAVKYAVQVRQLRKEDVDARYVGNILKYAKNLLWNTSILSVDDKAIVPIGEPDAPVSTGVRGKELDKKRKGLFANTRVRKVIICLECMKSRCVYSTKRLNAAEKAVLEQIDESQLYTCGSSLFPSSSCYCDSIVALIQWKSNTTVPL